MRGLGIEDEITLPTGGSPGSARGSRAVCRRGRWLIRLAREPRALPGNGLSSRTQLLPAVFAISFVPAPSHFQHFIGQREESLPDGISVGQVERRVTRGQGQRARLFTLLGRHARHHFVDAEFGGAVIPLHPLEQPREGGVAFPDRVEQRAANEPRAEDILVPAARRPERTAHRRAAAGLLLVTPDANLHGAALIPEAVEFGDQFLTSQAVTGWPP